MVMTPRFTLDELGLMNTMIGVSLEGAEEHDAPAKIINTLQSIMKKLEPMIEEECNIFNSFQDIATQLDDLYLASKIIVQNPDAVTTDYQTN